MSTVVVMVRPSRRPGRPAATRRQLALDFAAAWGRLERSLDGSLSAARGISFAEYRLLEALDRAPDAMASRVELASAVGLTPSGVTRALRPLEKLKIVRTQRAERDARLALAKLTPAGRQLVAEASVIVEDVMGSLLENVPGRRPTLADVLAELAPQ